ncbi:MAG: hypothetical protein MUC68_14120 [Burkholderiaceae bacterium]|nr:hypothetical protein [Burkholderiaceae bacterium]
MRLLSACLALPALLVLLAAAPPLRAQAALTPEQREQVLRQMTPEQRQRLWQQMTPEQKGNVLRQLTPEQRESLRENMTPEQREQFRQRMREERERRMGDGSAHRGWNGASDERGRRPSRRGGAR